MYAPIVVFAYNRPDHLQKVLDALAENPEAKESDLFIFIDGPKNSGARTIQNAVKKVAEKSRISFKKVTIKAEEKNQGLAKSIIKGVSMVLEQYDKVIVTEDDSLSSKAYLKFMNEALCYYEKDPTVWSIGGYTVPMKLPQEYAYDVVATQRVSSYAWATWKNRWDKIDWEVEDYKKFRFNCAGRRGFNKWGPDRAGMLDDQMNGRINSWAIRFDYAMFKNKKYNIIPRSSLIQNIGHDGSGTHNGVAQKDSPFITAQISQKTDFKLQPINTFEEIRREFIKFFKESTITRAKHYIKNQIIFLRRNKNGY